MKKFKKMKENEKGKPIVRLGRKAMGLGKDRQATIMNTQMFGIVYAFG